MILCDRRRLYYKFLYELVGIIQELIDRFFDLNRENGIQKMRLASLVSLLKWKMTKKYEILLNFVLSEIFMYDIMCTFY